MIQKKVGIRLRYLQGPSQVSRHPIVNNNEQPSTDNGRKRQRSPSPLSRRRIFGKPNEQYQQPPPIYQHKPPVQNHHKSADNFRPNNVNYGSPLTNAQYNSHSVGNGNQYESQVQRLIQSLKKKSIQLQKKQQVIIKLRRQIQVLKAQNGSYIQQIKTLKAQLQFQKASVRNKQPQIYEMDNRLAKSANNNEEYQNITMKNKYNNQPYQQFGSPINQQNNNVRLNFNQNKNVGYRDQPPQPKPVRRNQMQPPNRQQDSIMSDYLSPLMVLNQPSKQQQLMNPFKQKQKSVSSKSVKGNSRIQYEIPQRQQATQKSFDQQRFNIKSNNIQPNLYASQNPFSKKNFYQQEFAREPPAPPKFGYETAGRYQDKPQSYQNIGHGQQQQQQPEKKPWPTLESSAAHFNTNYLEQIVPSRNPRRQNQTNHKKQLQIQDSKQFRFEDFDFSQLDNSQVSNF